MLRTITPSEMKRVETRVMRETSITGEALMQKDVYKRQSMSSADRPAKNEGRGFMAQVSRSRVTEARASAPDPASA